jgi:hypothetical protein
MERCPGEWLKSADMSSTVIEEIDPAEFLIPATGGT